VRVARESWRREQLHQTTVLRPSNGYACYRSAVCAFQAGGPGNPTLTGTCSNLLGNAGRNEVYGPGLVNFDFSLFKDTTIKENLKLQFRAEFFNVFNHSNFNSPIANSSVFNQDGSPVGSAGGFDSTSTSNREIQFALKLIFWDGMAFNSEQREGRTYTLLTLLL
jgi:hypothetical protein